MFRLYYSSICSVKLYIFFQLCHVMHAQNVSTADTYSTLPLLLMQVQVLSIQITRRSVPDPYSAISVVSPHFSRTIYMLLYSVFHFSFSFARISWGLVPATLVSQMVLIHTLFLSLPEVGTLDVTRYLGSRVTPS